MLLLSAPSTHSPPCIKFSFWEYHSTSLDRRNPEPQISSSGGPLKLAFLYPGSMSSPKVNLQFISVMIQSFFWIAMPPKCKIAYEDCKGLVAQETSNMLVAVYKKNISNFTWLINLQAITP